MLKNLTRLEATVGDKVYQLLCDQDSPLEHVKEALFQFQKYVGKIEDAIKAQEEAAKAKAAESAPPVESEKVIPIDQAQG